MSYFLASSRAGGQMTSAWRKSEGNVWILMSHSLSWKKQQRSFNKEEHAKF
jgi:hypothetical protein